MSGIEYVRVDQGGINARILAKEAKADFRRVEAASLKIRARFTSADGKRYFARMFNVMQVNTHFISVIARTRVDHDEIYKIEAAIKEQMEKVTAKLNGTIDRAEALFKSHGITCSASYDTVPLDIEVLVISSITRRFLEILLKLDQLMPLQQTLEIYEVMTQQALEEERGDLKRAVRAVANSARNFATALRRRMNALERGDGIPPPGTPVAVADGSAAEPDPLHGADTVGEVVQAPAAPLEAAAASPAVPAA